MTFGITPLNRASATQAVTVGNIGADNLSVSSIAIAGDFTQTNNCSSVVPNATCTINVAFRPTAAGTRTGTLIFKTNDPQHPTMSVAVGGMGTALLLNPTALTYGTAAATQTFTVQNLGATTLTGLAFTKTGANTADFTVTAPRFGGCGTTLGRNSTCTMFVSFAGATTIRNAAVSVASSDPAGAQAVSLTGGVAPAITLAPTSLAFSNQNLNTTSSAQSFTVTSSGNWSVNITGIAVSGQFAQTNSCPASLAVNATCTVNVTFTPTSTGTKTGSVTVTPGSPATAKSVTLSGTGTSPYGVSPTSLAFSGVARNTTSASKSVTVSNTGATSATLTTAISGLTANQFAVASGGTCGTNITAGSSRAVGKITADETRVDQITALADGVVRSVSAYAAGSVVHKDDLLATYFVATRDLFNAMQGFILVSGKLDTNLTSLRNNGVINTSQADARVEEEILKSYSVTSKQIKDMIQTREVTRDIEFRAPRSGVVLDRNVFSGAAINKGAELFRIADLSRIWILADVFENDADSYRPGTIARVIYEGRTYTAIVTNARQFDAASHTLKLRLEMDNPGMVLRPDMFVRVELNAKERPGLSVPSDSVVNEGLKKLVFVSTARGVYEPRTVTTGVEYNGRVQILSGLEAGDAVVVSGMFLLDSESRLQAAATPQSAPLKPASNKHASAGDPVCGMSLSGTTEHSSVYQGITYHFCSKDCKEKFEKNPAAYVPQSDKKADLVHGAHA